MRLVPLVRVSIPALFAAMTVACQPPAPAVVQGPRGEGAALAPAVPTPPTRPARAGAPEPSREGWNRAQIDWISYDAAIARARTEHKPIVLVMHADWCPHCHNYAHVFEDPRIVEQSRHMLMVLLDVDESPQVANRFQIDGGYVPRTYFVGADGNAMADIDAHRPQFRYFFDERNPTSLLGGMQAALARR